MVKIKEVDFKDVDAMVNKHTPLVHHIVQKHFPWVHNTSHYDDAVQEGLIGLIKCIKLFDEDKGVQFSTYAYTSIQRSIYRGLRSINTSTKVPRDSFIKYRDYLDLSEEGLSIEEIAAMLNMTVNSLRGIVNSYNYCSIYTEVYNSGGDPITLLDSIPAEVDDDDWTDTAYAIHTLIKLLPPRDRVIFEMRLNGSTQKEVAEVLGVGRVHVSRLIQGYESRYIRLFKDFLLGNLGYGEMLLTIYDYNRAVGNHLKSYIDYTLELCDRGHPFRSKVNDVLIGLDLRSLVDELDYKRPATKDLIKLVREVDKHCSFEGIESVVDEMTGSNVYVSWLNVLAECQYVDKDCKMF